MVDIDKINDFIQSHMKNNRLSSITVVEVASYLDKQGLLKDRKDRRGAPLRKYCRSNEIHNSYKSDGYHWVIDYDPHYKLRLNDVVPTPMLQNTALNRVGATAKEICEKYKMPYDYTEASLVKIGFVGFQSIVECHKGHYAMFPKCKGIYMILRRSNLKPKFLQIGSGGNYKGKNPNVTIAELMNNWVDGANVVYIGKTDVTLHKRLSAYLKFGKGKSTSHWGGRLIWQLADHEELIVCWKEMKKGSPRDYEKNLIDDFKKRYMKRPFANLDD